MPDPLVVQSARQFKAQLAAKDALAMQSMAQRWSTVEAKLDAQISVLSREMNDLRNEGKEVSEAMLYRDHRYRSLKVQTEAQFAEYAQWATPEITEQQAQLAKLGVNHAGIAIGNVYAEAGVLGTFDRLPLSAVENMAGIAGDGKPLGDLLKNRIHPDYSDAKALSAWQSMTDTLVKNTALGINPRVTALAMKDDLAGGLDKGLTIARTEQLRVYRLANQQQYEESGVVTGHKRICDHTDRTCIACLADEGTLYPVSVPIPDHISGRCSSVPQISGLPDLPFETGEEWLSNMSDEDARKIMGPGYHDAWKSGTPMKEFVQKTQHKIWGESITPRPLKDLQK